MPGLELFRASNVVASHSGINYSLIQTNLDQGVIRMKSVHIDMVFSPLGGASACVVMDVCLHRHHVDLANADLDDDEGTRVKYERLVVGEDTSRYYRMWLKAINLENGYALTLVSRPIDVGGGSPSFGLGARFWQMVSTD